MKINIRNILLISFLLPLLWGCSPTKFLEENEYMLTKNTIIVTDSKAEELDGLINFVRPIPNKKFMGLFQLKTTLWAYHQPQYSAKRDSIVDTKFNQWLRKQGELPILLDSVNIDNSIRQINLAVAKNGYFDAQTTMEVSYLKKKKAHVNYTTTVYKPYHIKNISYNIEIPEFRWIVLRDTANAKVKAGMQYSEENLIEERNKIVSNIRNEGYYYVNSSLVSMQIDTNYAHQNLDKNGNPTLSIYFNVNLNRVADSTIIQKHNQKFRYNDVYIYTNYDDQISNNSKPVDTVSYINARDPNNSTRYYFITATELKNTEKRVKLIKDYKSKTIIDAITIQKDNLFSSNAYRSSYRKLSNLNNFSIINISYSEDTTLYDAEQMTRMLNTTFKLTREKVHSIDVPLEVQTDRFSLQATYTNKNIFKGAEVLSVNAFGSLFYYNWWNQVIKGLEYDDLVFWEFGGNFSLDFPKLLFLRQYQNDEFLYYKTAISAGGSYSALYDRILLYLNYSYKWAPKSHINHVVSPIDVTTLDSRTSQDDDLIATYPDSYVRKFDKTFLLSLKYSLNYTVPNLNKSHLFQVQLFFESSGLLLTGLNKLITPEKQWDLFNSYEYGAFEKVELNLKYTKIINDKNAIAARFNCGVAIPFIKNTVIPFERSYFIGGASSMRGWTFRSLGPGGYHTDMQMERGGDIKLEINLEYRGTIYRAFKYAVFTDMGNIWLSKPYEGMPLAEFRFDRFYKEIAMCAGVGLRLDFSFFVVRLDYGFPFYDPSKPEGEYWFDKTWHQKGYWNWAQGLQFGINYAF